MVNMDRIDYLHKIQEGFKTASVVALLGPRQCGKTFVARMYAALINCSDSAYFDLENPLDLIRLDDPMLALSSIDGIVIIDEIQKVPDLFSCLRVLVVDVLPALKSGDSSYHVKHDRSGSCC